VLFDISLSHLIYAQSLSLFFYDILQPFDKHLYAFPFNSPHGPVANPSTGLVLLYNVLGVLLGTIVEERRQHEYIRLSN